MAAPSNPLYRDDDFYRIYEVPLKTGDGRNPFRRDLSRLIHCSGFRRLQGKMQLFPSDESDFFRNRLTHSMEVGQIASGIATNLNASNEFFQHNPLDESLLTFAGLAHDIGHPPFGHNGERALNEMMHEHGGFEGNAQTLRILTRLQKKETGDFPTKSRLPEMFSADGKDLRAGLNVTVRALASVLKYDQLIPETAEKADGKVGDRYKIAKGYYKSERDIVRTIKRKVIGRAVPDEEKIRTVECCILDLADDIAYSTYDFEDALKAGFCSPLAAIALTDKVKADIAKDIHRKMVEEYGASGAGKQMEPDEVTSILFTLFAEIFEFETSKEAAAAATDPKAMSRMAATVSTKVFSRSHTLSDNGYLRAEFTSKMVHDAMEGIEVQVDDKVPALSRVRFTPSAFKVVEVLKRITRESVIQQHRLKMTERGGREIVRSIFEVLLTEHHGRQLLPDDWKEAYFSSDEVAHRRRVVCDFIAGMTDRYCLEFYNRLQGVNAPSFFKP